ncbi:putative deferrochelatase/peroxidase YfeX [Metarhizium anisopliae]|nr:putative deferrochelatase/peroxidase YfeX [Metarhizium anisopliae]
MNLLGARKVIAIPAILIGSILLPDRAADGAPARSCRAVGKTGWSNRSLQDARCQIRHESSSGHEARKTSERRGCDVISLKPLSTVLARAKGGPDSAHRGQLMLLSLDLSLCHRAGVPMPSLIVTSTRITLALQARRAGLTLARYTSSKSTMSSQPVASPLTQSATFLVVSATESPDAIATIRAALSSVADIAKNVSIRHPSSNLSCVVGIGSSVWDRLTGIPKPKELHAFPEVRGAKHTAVSTPGDLLFHIRAERRDISFEFENQLLMKLGGSVKVEDETTGFRYFDARDLLGFVDGTANPVGPDVADAVCIAEADDVTAVGGSYIVVQKYVHDIDGWRGLSTEQQEAVIGRTKLDNMELDDAQQGQQQSHKTLATIQDEDGDEHDILRDNMPFGSPGHKEFGTYFIGYSKKLWVIEKMMERMFIGNPPGKHDRILDFSTPVTGTTFYAPPTSILEKLG